MLKHPLRLRITNMGTGVVLARRVWLVRGFWDRVRGLYGRPPLMDGDALVQQPSRSAHTIGISHAIVAVYVDGEGRVIAAPLLEGGKIGPYRRETYMIIMLPASRNGQATPGDLIEVGIEGPGGRTHRPRRRQR